DSELATGYYSLGNLFYEQEMYRAAQTQFQEAILLGLDDADVHFLQGMSLWQEDHHTLALPYLLRATELEPDDLDIKFQYGLLLAQIEELDAVEHIIKLILNGDESNADALYNLVVIDAFEETYQEALNQFNKALEFDPEYFLAANGKKNMDALLTEE